MFWGQRPHLNSLFQFFPSPPPLFTCPLQLLPPPCLRTSSSFSFSSISSAYSLPSRATLVVNIWFKGRAYFFVVCWVKQQLQNVLPKHLMGVVYQVMINNFIFKTHQTYCLNTRSNHFSVLDSFPVAPSTNWFRPWNRDFRRKTRRRKGAVPPGFQIPGMYKQKNTHTVITLSPFIKFCLQYVFLINSWMFSSYFTFDSLYFLSLCPIWYFHLYKLPEFLSTRFSICFALH